MNQKDVKKLLEAYLQLNKEHPNIYELSMEAHMKQATSSYERLAIADRPIERQIVGLLSLEEAHPGLAKVKLYDAFLK